MSPNSPSFSTSDLSRKSGDIIAEALRHPVTITQRNKPRLVLMSIEDFEQLRRHGDPRRAMRMDQIPEDLLAGFVDAVEAYERDAGA